MEKEEYYIKYEKDLDNPFNTKLIVADLNSTLPNGNKEVKEIFLADYADEVWAILNGTPISSVANQRHYICKDTKEKPCTPADKPTDKQISWVKNLCAKHDLDIDEIPFTKYDYSNFIDEWKDW